MRVHMFPLAAGFKFMSNFTMNPFIIFSFFFFFPSQYLFGLFSNDCWKLFLMVEWFNSWPDVRLLESITATFREGAVILT